MKHAVLVSLGLVLGLAAGGCPPPSVSNAALVAGTYLGTLDCRQTTELDDGTVVVDDFYQEAGIVVLTGNGQISIQGHDYLIGAVWQTAIPDVVTVETVTGVVYNDTSILTQSTMVQNPVTPIAVYSAGQRNIVLEAQIGRASWRERV